MDKRPARGKNIHEMTQNIVMHQRFAINWSFALVFAGPFIASMILFIVLKVSGVQPDSWVNWILAAMFIPLILLSLIIAQKRELIGAYGETILLLIPTFVWLLPGHDQSKETMITISFAIIAFGLLVYIGGSLIKYWKVEVDSDKLLLKRKLVEVFLRIGFIAAAVTSTLIISIILINWGDFSLHLARVTDPVSKLEITDYTSKGWITFISVVTILTALTLVILGLVSGAKERFKLSLKNNSGYKKNSYSKMQTRKGKKETKKTNKSSLTQSIMMNTKRKKRK